VLLIRQSQHFAVILAFVALMNGWTPLVNARGHQKIYHGAWFTIRYPEEFIPKGSLPSFSNDGFDSVFFLEPHGLVEFYVYSPQWGGIASDIKLIPAQEELISKSEENTKSHKVLWITLAAKDGSYLRSIEEKRSMDDSSVTVFSIKYRDAKVLSAFRNAYKDFKQTLTQSTD
jgi:hypothetical protein